mmetsp:Transcript_17064/g.48998  ORF Transcript_17064/g.48998 Transcript_17064/m.48998 type:complete len:294 (-) Transcript_17064:268-1149(-)
MGRNDSGIVNNLLFPHPPGVRLLHKQIDRIARGVRVKSKFDGFIVLDELPKTVSCHNDKFVRFGVKFALGELGVGDNASSMCNGISERSRHGKAGNIHVPEPNTGRSVNSIIVLDGKHAAAGGNNPFLLPRRIGLMVVSELLGHHLPVLLPANNDTRVANVDTGDSVATDDGHGEGGAAELRIDSEIADDLMLNLGNGIGRRLLDIGGPVGMRDHLGGELVTEVLRHSVTVLSVSIEDAQDESISSRVVGHDEGILVLLPRIVWGVSLLGYTGIFRYGTSDGRLVHLLTLILI